MGTIALKLIACVGYQVLKTIGIDELFYEEIATTRQMAAGK